METKMESDSPVTDFDTIRSLRRDTARPRRDTAQDTARSRRDTARPNRRLSRNLRRASRTRGHRGDSGGPQGIPTDQPGSSMGSPILKAIRRYSRIRDQEPLPLPPTTANSASPTFKKRKSRSPGKNKKTRLKRIQSQYEGTEPEVSVTKNTNRRFSYGLDAGRRMSANIAGLSKQVVKMFQKVQVQKVHSRLDTGRVFWLHHGECICDEKNSLTGVIDTPLTEYGMEQAQHAGRDVVRTVKECFNGKMFEIVYCSYMIRALETMRKVIETPGTTTPDAQCIVRGDLAGRSFGVFTNTNKTLLRNALGFEIYDKLLHSVEASPLGGEGIESIHRRCDRFYSKKIVPHLQLGENVLVITHACILNVMAHVLANKDIKDYKDFEIPHGKVFSSKDLTDLMAKETKNNGYFTYVGRTATVHAGEVIAAAFLLGVATRVADSGEGGIPDFLYDCLLVILLAISSFYTFMKVNVRQGFHKVPKELWCVVVIAFFLRWALASIFLCYVAISLDMDSSSTGNATSERSSSGAAGAEAVVYARWCLWWLVPPALNTTSLSLLMGGDLYPSATISMASSVFVPPLLVFVIGFILPGGTRLISIGEMQFFYTLIACGFVIPCFFSQLLRWWTPVHSKKHGHRWHYLGLFAYIANVYIVGYRLTPRDLIGHVREMCSFSSNDFNPAWLLVPLFSSLIMTVATRVLGVMATRIATRLTTRVTLNHHQLMDVYLLLTNSNFFLWISILINHELHGADGPTADSYALFFGGFAYFLMFPIERKLVIEEFVVGLIQQSVSNMRMPQKEIDKLWEQVKHAERKFLTTDDLSYAIWLISTQTQGWAPGPAKLKMLAGKLLTVINVDSNHDEPFHVYYEDFMAYFAMHGKKLDFNTSMDGEDGTTEIYAHLDTDAVQLNRETFVATWFKRRRHSSITKHFRRLSQQPLTPEQLIVASATARVKPEMTGSSQLKGGAPTQTLSGLIEQPAEEIKGKQTLHAAWGLPYMKKTVKGTHDAIGMPPGMSQVSRMTGPPGMSQVSRMRGSMPRASHTDRPPGMASSKENVDRDSSHPPMSSNVLSDLVKGSSARH